MERKLRPCGFVLFSQLVFCAAIGTFNFEVLEELEVGTFVADMGNNSIVDAFKSLDGDEGVRFQFQGVVPAGSFAINATTGVIKTAGKLDRENLSLYEDKFQLQVRVSKGKISAVIPTEIKVLDVNDNSPTFTESLQNISVSESAPLGAELPITVAKDKDIGSNGVQTYEIVSRNDGEIFRLKISRPTSQLTKLKLVVSKRLDREKNHSFYLVVEARDGGNPPRVGRKGLNVTVLDSNDHFPKFSKDLYVGEVRENSKAGTFILQVSATDGDIGTNAEIVYSLKPPPQHRNLFILDAVSGELRTNTVLDYELSNNYQLEVTARDKGPDSIPSTAAVNVKVLDENDNSPEITVTNLTDSFDQQGRIPEDAAVNTGVAIVTVRDKDSGRNGRVTVTLRHHKQDFDLQEMFPGQYILRIQRPLNLDRHAQYNIKIIATDQGLPATRESNQVFSVQLADSNRHAPVFTQMVYNLEVRDDFAVGAIVTTATAVDKDFGKNAELTYSLESMRIGTRNGSDGDKAKWFSINSLTGQVRLLSKLWCTFTPSFALSIDARDNGRQPLHGKTALNISVRCSDHVYNFTVAENEPAGTAVGRIHFSTVSSHRPLRARLMSAFNVDFAIDNKTGILTTKRTLDREDIDSYTLVVVLSDGGLDVKLVVNIDVVDVNDNAPVFVGLTKQRNITITSAFSRGATVLQVEAVDEDFGSNGLVKYAIVSGNDDRVFHVTRRGKITLLKNLTKKSYYLLIRASDSGYIEKESFLRLGISVRFITPAPPVSGFPGKDPETKSGEGEVDSRQGVGGFLSDTKMIIVVAVCAGFFLLTVILIVVLYMKCKRKDRQKKDGGNRGSYHEPDISREDALMASKKMFHEATAKRRQSPDVVTYNMRNRTINISPIPMKKMHPMTYQSTESGPPLEIVKPDMYYPVDRSVDSCGSDEEPDSGRGGSSRESSPYCAQSPPSRKREDDWRPPHRVRYDTPARAPYRVRSPGMPPPPPPYEEVPRRGAFVRVSDVMHSSTDL